jgi:hypothetical protein
LKTEKFCLLSGPLSRIIERRRFSVLRLFCYALLLALVLTAASPVAKITSGEPFILSGAKVPVTGVANWPLVAGDEIVTAKAPGRIDFPDGSRVYVMPNSKLRVTVERGRTLLRLDEGALSYRLARESRLGLTAGSRESLPRDSRGGRLLVTDSDAWWNPANLDDYLSADGLLQNNAPVFRQYKLTPLNLAFANLWRQYEPAWGTPPGVPGKEIPIADPIVEAPQPQPVSNWRP